MSVVYPLSGAQSCGHEQSGSAGKIFGMGCVADGTRILQELSSGTGAHRGILMCAGACGNTAYSRRLDVTAKQTRAGRADRTWAGSRCQSCRS